MRTPPLRLACAALFWRVFLVTFSIQQFTAFHKTRHQLRLASPGEKFAAFLDFTPYALVLALLVASLVVVGVDGFVRFILRPLLARWYHPGPGLAEGTPLAFHLDNGEKTLVASPARFRAARGWRAGTLVLTDRTLAYYPREWDAEPWRTPLPDVRGLRVTPARAALGSLLLGLPGHLVVRTADGREHALAVADPHEVLAWFTRPA